MDAAAKARALRLIKSALGIMTAGALYYVFIALTGLAIPCPFKLVTGLDCPGCGITRYCVSMIRLDTSAAFSANPFIYLYAPFLLAYGIHRAYVHIRYGKKPYRPWEIIFLTLSLIAALIFGVWRNL